MVLTRSIVAAFQVVKRWRASFEFFVDEDLRRPVQGARGRFDLTGEREDTRYAVGVEVAARRGFKASRANDGTTDARSEEAATMEIQVGEIDGVVDREPKAFPARA